MRPESPSGMYEDRATAGRRLGEELAGQHVCPDVVLAIPAGGINVARPVCERFDADLGLIASETIRTSSTDGLPIAAVTDAGVAWVDENAVDAFDVDDETLAAERRRAFRDARDKRELYEDAVGDPTPRGTVAVVGDGVIDSLRMNACVSAIGRIDDADAVAAAPIGTADAAATLQATCDEVVFNRTVADGDVLSRYYGASDRTPGA